MAAARGPEDAPALHRIDASDCTASDEQVARAAAELVIAELVQRGDLPPSALQRHDAGGAIRR